MEAKYKVYDEVFLVYKNKVEKDTILGVSETHRIHAKVGGGVIEEHEIEYYLDKIGIDIPEYRLFNTEEELNDSLFENM